MTTLPTIHSNGTSPDRLIDAWVNAADAISEAITVMRQAAPNGRDYYTQGAGAYERAADEHMARMRKLQDVYDELVAMANSVSEAKAAKLQVTS